MTIRILVIDDHPMVRAGVRAELENSGADLEVVGHASDVEGAIAACRALTPDVALLDVHLPGGNGGGGAEVASTCRDIEGLHFLALSVWTRPRTSSRLFAPAPADTSPSRSRPPTSSRPLAALRPGTPPSARAWPASCSTPSGLARCPRPTLSWTCCPRASRRSCALIARGYTYKEVAHDLFISIETVETLREFGPAQAPALQPQRADALGDAATHRVRSDPFRAPHPEDAARCVPTMESRERDSA